MQLLKRLGITVMFFFLGLAGFAQDSTNVSSDMNSIMRSHDKIYVVMAVCLLILIALFFYLIRIDLKISKMEKE